MDHSWVVLFDDLHFVGVVGLGLILVKGTHHAVEFGSSVLLSFLGLLYNGLHLLQP